MENIENNEEQQSQSRKRQASDSSGSSDCSSRGSSSDRSSKVAKRSRQTVRDMQFQFLTQQVSFLTSLITQNNNNTPQVINASSVVCEEVPKNINDSHDFILRPPAHSVVEEKQKLYLSDLTTNIKDPVFSKSKESHLLKLSQIQRFKSSDWNSIRFYEPQKKYVTTPGFIELNINDELRRFSASSSEDSRLHYLERTFAALTNAIISQKEELNIALQKIVDWAGDKNTTLTPKNLFDKIESSFNKDSTYTKVTDDILQIVCGRRADCIQSRRELLLKQIPDEFHSGALQKIPPTYEFLFDENLLNIYLQKIGGAEKLAVNSQILERSSRPLGTDPKPSCSYNYGSKLAKEHTERFFRSTYTGKKGKGKGKSSSKQRSSYNKFRSGQDQKGKKSNYNSTTRNKNNKE